MNPVQKKIQHPLQYLAIGFFTYTLTFGLWSCSNTPEQTPQLTEQQYYITAQKAMDASNFLMAVEQLEQLESRFPFGRYAINTQLDLIYAYYRSQNYDATVLQAERFIRQHSDHPDVDYAYYMKGLANFSTDRGLIARFLPTSPAQRDLTAIKKTFADFSQLINKFPESRYTSDARQRMIYLKNLLALHEVYAAEYYLERKAFVATANRARYILENFPQTPAVPKAMALAVKAYRELGMETLAHTTEQLLVENFPDYEELDQNGQLLYHTALEKSNSWLSKLSFGLFR